MYSSDIRTLVTIRTRVTIRTLVTFNEDDVNVIIRIEPNNAKHSALNPQIQSDRRRQPNRVTTR